MSFLTLNGMRIPCTEDTALSFEDAGRVGRGATGQLSKDRRFVARKWEVKTAPLTPADFAALRGFIQGTAYTFPLQGNLNTNLPTDTLVNYAASNVLYVSNLAADGTQVVPGAKFGAYSAAISGTNSNLWSSNIATGTDASSNTTGFTAVSGGTITSDTARRWQGARSLKVVTASAGDGVRTAAYSPGYRPPFSGTFYITGTSAPVIAKMWADSTLMGSITVTPDGTWQRVLVPQNGSYPAGTPTDVRLEVTAVGGGAASYWLDGLMLEITSGSASFAQAWVDGSRTAASELVRTATGAGTFGSKQGCSVNIWSTQPTLPVGASLISLWDDTTSKFFGIRCYYNSGLNTVFPTHEPAAMVSDGTIYLTAPGPSAISWPSLGTWKMLTAVLVPRPAQGCPSLALYVNGVLWGSSTVDLSAIDPTVYTILWIGQENGAWFSASQLQDATVFPYPLGPIAVKGLFDANTAMPSAWPVLTASGSMIAAGNVQVVATLTKSEFTPFVDLTGVFQRNGVIASLTLMEAL